MRLLKRTRNIPHGASKEVWGNVLPQIEWFSVVAQKQANDHSNVVTNVITVRVYLKNCLVGYCLV